ncbi:MAG TPA: asparagine synthase-related protein [Vicinamibacterales bacterium]|nr:asparagine synthase-related protein [Vicinamibacterales bacterium]
MSGIVGVVRLDGAPVDRGLLCRMTDSLAYRGPDGQQVWVDGPAGFGHTLLRTTVESDSRQPASLDGCVWITADARVDGRAELVNQLASRGRNDLQSAGDAHLILHAYHCWGEDCVEHLLGDFAFAIWDGRRRRLFCARDHFGVKPFYYARVRGNFVFSNTLDCVRLHPEVGDALNELAIGDFLLFSSNQDPTTTTFADVRRLAPAHSLTCGEGTIGHQRYWTLPSEGRIRYRRSQEYVDHFLELFQVAVSDRLRTNHVGVWMSGGLDSTSVAATAKCLLSKGPAAFTLRAHTTVYDTLIPDEERRYAGIAAEALGVEIDFFVADHYGPLDGWDHADLRPPEPSDNPFIRMHSHQLARAAAHSRVILSGDGADEVLWGSRVVDLLGRMRPLELAAAIARSLLFHHRRPAAGIRSTLMAWLGHRSRVPAFPAWVNDAFADRLNLRARWEQVQALEPMGDHPLRPEASGRLAAAPWPRHCEASDPGATRILLECRYPFLDLRLVSYLLAIPPLPWCIDKHILRVAIRDILPGVIRLRAKTPLAGDPLRATLLESGGHQLDQFEPTPDLERFVNRSTIPPLAGGYASDEPWLHVRPLSLNHWLRGMHAARDLEEVIAR